MLTKEPEILDQAIAAFQRETNLRIQKGPLEVLLTDGRRADAVVQIDFPGKAAKYWVEVKPTLTNIVLGQLTHQLAKNLDKWLLVTRYAYPQLVKTMRELRVQFIDTVGNAYIDNPPTLILIQANRPLRAAFAKREEGMLGRAGLRLVFALLCKHDLWNATYRDMARAANVALGTAVGIIKELMKQGYLIEIEEHRRLNRTEELLHKWIAAYAERLRPRTLIGRYTAPRPDFWRNAEIDRFGALWGGETAAQWLTHYLKPEITTIYAKKPINDLLLNLRLRKDDEGDVVLRERFWEFDNGGVDKTLVPPLLVYADLMATADARNIETAKMIHDEYLRNIISQH